MKKKSIFISLLGLVLLSGCTSSSTVGKEVKSLTTSTYKTIKSSQFPKDYLEYSEGKKEFLLYHSDSQSDVDAFKTEYGKLTDDITPEFDGNMIIAKSGTKMTGGYEISIADVKDAGRYTEVTILLVTPADECMVTTALTNPYIIAEIPNDHKDVKFIEKHITKACD